MRIGKDIISGVKDVAKTAITGKRAQDTEQTIEMEMEPTQKFSWGKSIISIVIVGIVLIGAYKFLTTSGKDLITTMQAYKEYLLALAPILGPFIVVVAGGRAFKHSIWSKDK